ncbi:hypothetical protein V8J62_13040 [Phyllobacterium sp. CCNWLW11]
MIAATRTARRRAAAVVLASEASVRQHNLQPLARPVAYGYAGVDPAYMGIGPVPAMRLGLDRAGLGIADIDVIKSSEALSHSGAPSPANCSSFPNE